MSIFIKRVFGWEIPESRVTDQSVYLNRRALLRGLGGGILGLSLGSCKEESSASEDDSYGGEVNEDKLYSLTRRYYPGSRNDVYEGGRPLTEREYAIYYNNFYEFGSGKYIWQEAQALETHPWEIVIDGLVENPMRLEFTDLLRRMPIEQRIYRHRCVEAWAMTVPWDGFAFRHLVALASPLSGARYVRMETLADEGTMRGLRQHWYPWPYVEGLTLAEAMHDLAFIATGLYGEPIPKQNGSPLRLAVPWKYGFKSLKSIKKFTFTDERPVSFWEQLQGGEYGFWANVNPDVRHPRWSQASERLLGEDRRVPTQIYNGYGEFVAPLYAGMNTNGRELFF